MVFRPSGALWRHAGFVRLWAAQTVSSFGARIAREGFAMTAILSIHATPGELGVLTALARGPGAVVGLLAGGFVDRSSRKRVMIVSDIARACLILTLPLAAWFQVLTMRQLYLAAGAVGAFNILFEIADHAFLPSLIAREYLLDGNAKLATTESLAEIGGPALAGTLFQLFTAPFAMVGTAFTYLASALFLFSLPAKGEPAASASTRTRWYADVAEGWSAIRAESLVRPLLAMTAVFTFFGNFFGPLYLLFGLKVLGMSPALMGLTIAMGGVGALFGASLSTTISRRLGIGRTIVVCGFAYAIALALVPLARAPLWLGTFMLMAAQLGGDGFAMAFIIPINSLRQAVLPPAALGRTAAFFSAVAGAMTILGSILGGVLGDAIGVRVTLSIAVAGIATAPLFVFFSPLRTLAEIPEAKPDD
jgi:predicted MFS family arabinose efflux permease